MTGKRESIEARSSELAEGGKGYKDSGVGGGGGTIERRRFWEKECCIRQEFLWLFPG